MKKFKRYTWLLGSMPLVMVAAIASGLMQPSSTNANIRPTVQPEAETVIHLCNHTKQAQTAVYAFPPGDSRIKGRLAIAPEGCTQSSPVLYKGRNYVGSITFYFQGVGAAQQRVAPGANRLQIVQDSNQRLRLQKNGAY